MSPKQDTQGQRCVRYINSPGFIEKMIDSMSIHRYCMNLSSNARVTRSIITKLSSISVYE